MSQLHDLTALEQGAAVRAREVSPDRARRALPDRVERLSDSVGAFVTVTARLARRQAASRGRGAWATPARPLSGVPTAIKDLNLTAGVRTSSARR